MYNNIGGKIKTLAQVSFFVEAAGAIISGLALIVNENWWGIFIVLGGPIVAWVSSWLLYGFGQLISNSDDIIFITKHQSEQIEAIKKAQKPIEKTDSPEVSKAKANGNFVNATPAEPSLKPASAPNLIYGKPCPYCKTIINTKICPRCRKENNLF